MIQNIFIGAGILAVAAILSLFPGEMMTSDEVNDYILSKAYLAKNTESYARCYHSVNYGTSGLMDVEIEIQRESYGKPEITLDRLKVIENEFMENVKKKCNKPISEYEAAYKKAAIIQDKSESLAVGWRTFVFGGANQQLPSSDLSPYAPERVIMSSAFDDYIFTDDEARAYYDEHLRQ